MKIVYICSFSNDELRSRLEFSDTLITNYVGKLLGKNMLTHGDIAPWNPQFIHGFENDKDNEYYVILPQNGIKHETQEFDIRGVHYFVYNDSITLFTRFCKSVMNSYERTNYIHHRTIVKKKIAEIKPDLVVVCGAENPIYSWCAMDIPSNIPVLVILQTLLNDPKRIAMGVGSPYRMALETKILKKHHYFCVSEACQGEYLDQINPDAKKFEITFPCNCPVVDMQPKQFDFMFVAGGITKNKGIEDVISAMGIVCKQYPNASLNISGAIVKDYKQHLLSMIGRNNILNVSFQEPFLEHKDVFVHMTKTRCLVVPGITAGFNSTVKEGMLLGLPTICYETSVTKPVNLEIKCLLTARMEDISDLADKMIYTLIDKESTRLIAENGYKYAHSHFTSQAVTQTLLCYFKSIHEEKTKQLSVLPHI